MTPEKINAAGFTGDIAYLDISQKTEKPCEAYIADWFEQMKNAGTEPEKMYYTPDCGVIVLEYSAHCSLSYFFKMGRVETGVMLTRTSPTGLKQDFEKTVSKLCNDVVNDVGEKACASNSGKLYTLYFYRGGVYGIFTYGIQYNPEKPDEYTDLSSSEIDQAINLAKLIDQKIQ